MKGSKILLVACLMLSIIGISQAQQWVSFGKTTGTVMEPKMEKSSKSGLVLEFSVPGLQVGQRNEKGTGYHEIVIPGAGHDCNNTGYPSLPVYSQAIAIPPASGVSYKIISATYKTLAGYNVYPVQDPLPDMKKAPAAVFRKDAAVYGKNEFYPASPITISDPALIRDLRFVHLLYHPVQYNPVTRELKVCTSLKVQIDFTGADMRNVPEKMGTMTRDFADMLSGFVINKEQFIEDSKVFQTSGKYYIITIDSFYNQVKPLAEWRQRMGYTTVVDSFSKINTASNDTLDICNAIKTAYTNWGVEYVLLVGDHMNGNNVRMLTSTKSNVGAYGYNPMPHDHNYSLTSGADFYSDVLVGRIPAQNASQCTTMVNKILRYEKTPYMTDPNWFHRAVGLGAYETGRIFTQTCREIRKILVNNGGFDVVDSLYEERGLLTNVNIDNRLEAGRAFTTFRGHGSECDPATGPGYTAYFGGADAGYPDAYRDTDFPNLNNGQMNGVVFAPTCLAADFAESLGAAPHKVMAEYFVNQRQGASGYFGAMDVSYSFYNDSLSVGIYHHIIDSGHTKFQQASNGGKLFMLKYYPGGAGTTTQYEFYLMAIVGDPAMDMWTDTPDSFNVTYASNVNVGAQTYNVNVKRKVANTNLQGAQVCLMMDDLTVYSVGTTDANGNVSFNINPVNSGNMYLTATKHNYKPFEGVAVVTSGTPSKPAVSKLLDGANLPDLKPSLIFVSTDPQGQSIDYRVIYDTTAMFSSVTTDKTVKDSTTTATYASGTAVNFQFPSNLTAGRTYWWKVKGRDPAGSNAFGPESDPRSFTVSTDIPAGTVSWMHTKAGQFSGDSYSGAVAAQGDSLILLAPSSVPATLINENFEGGALPAGWAASGTYPASYGWNIRTGGGTTPPSSGTYFEGCQFPTTGAGPSASEEILTASQQLMNTGAVACSLSYGYGFGPGVAADSLVTEASFKSGGTWGAWTQIDGFNAAGSGTRIVNLNASMPKEGIQVRWRFSQGGGKNGQDAAIDNVNLKYYYTAPNSNGTMISGPLYYKDITKAETVSRSSYKWGKILWRKKAAADSIGVQVQYCNNNTWALVSDAVLSGNSTGFFSQGAAVDSISLAGLDTVAYDSLRVVVNMCRPAAKASANPVLYDIELARPGYMNPLAVSLSFFTAFVQNNNAIVQWRTESEQNCLRWEIERSDNAEQGFVKTGELEGNGTTSHPRNYSYTDNTITEKGEYYYRLAEVDINGGKTYYGPMSIKFGGDVPAAYMLAQSMPNPTSGNASINFALRKSANTSLKIYNIAGQTVKTLVNENRQAGNYTVDWDGRDNKGRQVSNGVYFYKLVSGDYSATKKLTVLR